VSDQELPLEGVVPVARLTDPATSHAAAATVTNSDRLRWRILARLCDDAVARGARPESSEAWDRPGWLADHPCGMTDEALHAYLRSDILRCTPSGVRTRRSELTNAGLVQPHPYAYGQTAAGRRCHVWVPTGAGWRYWLRDDAAAVTDRHRRLKEATHEQGT
jgi:hypothetical protein